jgi:hypothetical protein
MDPDLKNRADEMYAAVFGHPAYGGPLTDGNYVFGIHNEGYSMTHSKAKDFGFLFGMGFAASWPAARLADQSDAVRRVLPFGYNMVP